MSKLARLIKGEIKRLIRYKILPVSLATAAIWIGLFLFISAEEARRIAPLVIFVDVATMSILLLGASHHLEKQDGTIRTMMVLPVSLGQVLTAKAVGSMLLALESAVVTAAALYVIHRITFDYVVLLLFVVVAGAAHAAIGLVLSLNSKDFTSMLGLFVIYLFVFTIPSILFSLGVVDAKYEWLFMISPSHAANHLISSAVRGEYEFGMAVGGCVYLAVLAAVLFRFAVYPKFRDNAARG